MTATLTDLDTMVQRDRTALGVPVSRPLGAIAAAEPVPNIDLLAQVILHIEAHPETWEQETWRCDTGMCFAGWATQLSGAVWAFEADHPTEAHVVDADPNIDGPVHHLYPYVTASERARVVLGLTEREAATLFRGSNDLMDIYRAAGSIMRRAVRLRGIEVD